MLKEFDTKLTITEPYIGLYDKKGYGDLLKYYGFSYDLKGYYLYVGEIKWPKGWVIHISVVAFQLENLLTKILPYLKQEKVPFKIVNNKEIAKSILNGQLGYILLGKVIAIYPSSDDHANLIAKYLIEISKPFKGPRILTDRFLGSTVYIHHGYFYPTNKENYINENEFPIIQATYSIPYLHPSDIQWPFGDITTAVVPKQELILLDKYKPHKILKEDARGNVQKALWLRKWWNIKWCIIKEGRQAMMADDYGRDIQDRLRWQLELHNELYGFLNIPKIYDLFQENGDFYLVMEYVKGELLDNIITDTFQNNLWCQLLLAERIKLLNLALQLLDMIDVFHERGYVHRDINPVNFLVNKEQKLVMIDLELAYCFKQNSPSPPFRYGTTWFMSPEQQAVQTPTIKEDTFAVGATLLVFLTGLLPNKFAITEISCLQEQLELFIEDKQLVSILTDCFQYDPELRPNISELKREINRVSRSQQDPNKSIWGNQKYQPDKEKLEDTINRSIAALATPFMMNHEQMWYSKTIQKDSLSYYQSEDCSVYEGFAPGVSGVLYLLSKAYKLGFSISPCMNGYTNCYEFVRRKIQNLNSQLSAGMYEGTGGMALALMEGLDSNLITGKEQILNEIELALNNPKLEGLGIAEGVSGQGVILLRGSSILNDSFITTNLKKIVSQLLQMQLKDGSWVIETEPAKDLKLTGFAYGIAGITCFLLEYFKKYKERSVHDAVLKSLHWLVKQSHKKGNQLFWYLDNKSKNFQNGMNTGWAGIIFCFIKAYEILEDPIYRDITETALRNYPAYITGRDLTLDTGITGIGEIYLEATRVFNSEEWQNRSNWITNLLLHQFQQQTDGSRYWILDHTPFSTAELMTGNTGIIHYLLRYSRPGRLSHPLMPI